VPLLSAYAWPGNVREVRNLMERVALFLAAEPLQALSPGFLMSVAPELARTPGENVRPVQQSAETIEQVLARFNGNREAAAKHLGISRTTLWRKIRQGSS
jgi:propionate catabolism operon transcriptional regulator